MIGLSIYITIIILYSIGYVIMSNYITPIFIKPQNKNKRYRVNMRFGIPDEYFDKLSEAKKFAREEANKNNRVVIIDRAYEN